MMTGGSGRNNSKKDGLLSNKKEKSIYGTRKLYEESLTCSEAEFTKFTDYWKELHESYEPTDYSYLKKDTSKGWL